ncbi:hypothetical protein EIN_340690 [Entamoeba invadens IP1]|uniref:Uncharacterized protein n=1 Tax=Entamoeba invadens IP1 TaxID=370355 RepID=A0A0A1UH55_ENTIV|nr:hypothetical protein EIN_340690 [Entamoeba invadens IP1]ELP94731.1 hypothetical protein EIN_340690 [Entamoeba invadens IP1]|eukprot:XP_004261502.1 hypothetical protein EIN_340690 [Entamoeba invadens IP1]
MFYLFFLIATLSADFCDFNNDGHFYEGTGACPETQGVTYSYRHIQIDNIPYETITLEDVDSFVDFGSSTSECTAKTIIVKRSKGFSNVKYYFFKGTFEIQLQGNFTKKVALGNDVDDLIFHIGDSKISFTNSEDLKYVVLYKNAPSQSANTIGFTGKFQVKNTETFDNMCDVTYSGNDLELINTNEFEQKMCGEVNYYIKCKGATSSQITCDTNKINMDLAINSTTSFTLYGYIGKVFVTTSTAPYIKIVTTTSGDDVKISALENAYTLIVLTSDNGKVTATNITSGDIQFTNNNKMVLSTSADIKLIQAESVEVTIKATNGKMCSVVDSTLTVGSTGDCATVKYDNGFTCVADEPSETPSESSEQSLSSSTVISSGSPSPSSDEQSDASRQSTDSNNSSDEESSSQSGEDSSSSQSTSSDGSESVSSSNSQESSNDLDNSSVTSNNSNESKSSGDSSEESEYSNNTSSDNIESSDNTHNGLSGGAITGIVLTVLILVILIIVVSGLLVYFLLIKKKKSEFNQF